MRVKEEGHGLPLGVSGLSSFARLLCCRAALRSKRILQVRPVISAACVFALFFYNAVRSELERLERRARRREYISMHMHMH